MSVFLTVLILIASVLMIGIVLIQKSKGGGLASNFASSNQIMGVRKTTDFVEKTWVLAATIVVLSIATALVGHNKPQEATPIVTPIENTLPAAATPGFEVPETPASAE